MADDFSSKKISESVVWNNSILRVIAGNGPTITHIESDLIKKVNKEKKIKIKKIKPIVRCVCKEYFLTYGEFGSWEEYNEFIFEILYKQIIDKIDGDTEMTFESSKSKTSNSKMTDTCFLVSSDDEDCLDVMD